MSYEYTIKEPPHAYMASSPTSERTLVYTPTETKYADSLPPPIQYRERKQKFCSKTCMWAVIVLCVVLGISLAVSLAVVYHNHGERITGP